MLYLGVLWLGTIVFATSIVLDVVNIKEKNMLEIKMYLQKLF
jgi:FtsH-binding integral membrane protein